VSSEGDENLLQALVNLNQLRASPKELDEQQAMQFLETLDEAERNIIAGIDVSKVEKAKAHPEIGGPKGQLYCYFGASKCSANQLRLILSIDRLLWN
jgi:hypothetical protein